MATTHQPPPPPAEVLDPVCGMTIWPADAAGHVDHRVQTYYFCSESCLERFRTTPDAFLGGTREETHAEVPGTTPVMRVEYTCPMHPEIVRDQPGACPICGMALEPRTIGLEDGPNPELIDMTRRFRIAAVLTVPVFLLAMGDMVLGMGLGGRVNVAWSNWL